MLGPRWTTIGLFTILGSLPNAGAQDPLPAPFKLVFVSNRQHYWYPHIYLYEHDGKSTGKLVTGFELKDKRLEHQPVVTGDGKMCYFGREIEGEVGQVLSLDLATNQTRGLGDLIRTPNAVFSPSVSSDGKLLAVSTWNRPGLSSRWDVNLFNLETRQSIELAGLNTSKYDERRAALSGDGNWIAYTTNNADAIGLTDIRLYEVPSKHVLPLPEMNSRSTDSFPSLTRDGRLICFASDREGGSGGFDIYICDRIGGHFHSLPGLNSPGHEQTPFISVDGRLIAFVSERFNAAGEHDIFIYDRATQRLLDTPGLNTDRDDYDPCIIALPQE